MFHACGLYVSRLRPLCFMLAASMFHACGLYVSCLRPLSTTHGYDKGRIAFWGARKRLGALAVLCGFERRACKHRGCEAGLKHRGWVCAFWLVLFGRAFSGSFFWVRSFGRYFRGSFFGFVLFGRSFRGLGFGFVLLVVLFVVRSLGSCFWSFFSWFVLLFVLLVVLFVVRSLGSCFWSFFRGSFFWSFFLWFVLLVRAFGGSYVFFVRCFKSLRGVCGKVRGFLMQR